MKFAILDCVVLARDLADHSLRAGDVGTVVETYEPGGLEVEFITARAVLTLSAGDVRRASRDDVLAVRSSPE